MSKALFTGRITLRIRSLAVTGLLLCGFPASAWSVACDADAIARAWLGALDAAVLDRDAAKIVDLFAPDVKVQATVRVTEDVMTSVEMGRAELAQNAVAAVRSLTDYQQRRPSIQAQTVDPGDRTCHRIGVRSLAMGQGRRAGRPYRFEAQEEYTLERRKGRWLAVKASTTQR